MLVREFIITENNRAKLDNSIDCPNCGWNWVRHRVCSGRRIECPNLSSFKGEKEKIVI